MSISIEQIILDAKRVANRLKDREALSDSLLVETEAINKQLETMRQFHDDIESFNKLARDNSNVQLINVINQQSPEIREIQQENRELRACLEDYQRAFEVVMSKYRQVSQKAVTDTRINFKEMINMQKNDLIRKQAEKIQEMAAIMQKASQTDEKQINAEYEKLSQLMIENQGLREMLEISKQFGSYNNNNQVNDDKSVQTAGEANDSPKTCS